MMGTDRESRKDFIGPYRVLAPLGGGGMGVVYLGIQDHLGREVAIKALAPELTRHPEFKERFFIEARTQARLQHTNIVTIYDLIEEEESFFIVMEYVPGGTLEALLTQRGGEGWTLGRSLLIFRQILAGLDYAHSKGVIHRDVKPSNVIVADGDLVKLTDFGIALLIGDKRLTASRSSIGTPTYMSPEQILRPRSVDHRTDIYSAAIALFEMLCGEPPFDADTEYEIKKLQIESAAPDPREFNPEVPEWITQALTVALRKDPDERFPSAGAFLRALFPEPALSSGPQLLPPRVEQPLPPQSEPSLILGGNVVHRPSRLRGSLVLAAVVGFLLLAGLIMRFHKDPPLFVASPSRAPVDSRPPTPVPAPLLPHAERGPGRLDGEGHPEKELASSKAGIQKRTETGPRDIETQNLAAARREIEALRTIVEGRRTGLESKRGSVGRLGTPLNQANQDQQAEMTAIWTEKLQAGRAAMKRRDYAEARLIAQRVLDMPDTPESIASQARLLLGECGELEAAPPRAKQIFRIERVEILSNLVQQVGRIIAVVHATVDPPLQNPLVVTIRAQILKGGISFSPPIQQDVIFPASSPSLKLRIPIVLLSPLPEGEYYIQTDLWNTTYGIQSQGKIRFNIR
jgi:serine/threonine protein kinase